MPKGWLAAFGALLAATAALLAQAPAAKAPPAQPIPYSHQQHLALKLQCKTCHTNPEPGEMMTFPAEATCMGCHSAVKADSPHIQKLAEFAKAKRPVPWVRVYQIPSYVSFSHRAHVEAGATCGTCHGPVAERAALWREVDTSMGACMECHRKNQASNDCTFCHEARQ